MSAWDEALELMSYADEWFTPGTDTSEEYQKILSAYRAEVLMEAADALTLEWGGPDHYDAMEEARAQLRRMASEAATKP